MLAHVEKAQIKLDSVGLVRGHAHPGAILDQLTSTASPMSRLAPGDHRDASLEPPHGTLLMVDCLHSRKRAPCHFLVSALLCVASAQLPLVELPDTGLRHLVDK